MAMKAWSIEVQFRSGRVGRIPVEVDSALSAEEVRGMVESGSGGINNHYINLVEVEFLSVKPFMGGS
jgi:hypothetical protein